MAQPFNIYKTSEKIWEFPDSVLFTGNDFINDRKSDFGFSVDYSFEPISDFELDDIGDMHRRYVQMYKNFPVEDNNFVSHQKGGQYFMVNGESVNNLELNVTQFITESEALLTALNEFQGSVFYWQDTAMEDLIKFTSDDSTATNFPVGTKIIKSKLENGMIIYEFCWKFEISTLFPIHESYSVYIKCSDGSLFVKQVNTSYCNGKDGTCTTPYYGNRNFRIKERGWPNNDHILQTCPDEFGKGIITTKLKRDGQGNEKEHGIVHGSANWGTDAQHGTQAHFLGQKIYTYFNTTWKRNSYDNKGCKVILIVEDAIMENQSAWDPSTDWIRIGKTTAGNPMSAADVLAHEYTHGIISKTCNLANTGQPGALNEALGYIFGALFERNFKGTINWTSGEDIPVRGATRNLQDPNIFGDPKMVGGTFWNINNDIHRNAGVINRWFYILSVSDAQNNVSVQGIGIDNAASIVWNTMINYMTKGTNFEDARRLTTTVAQRTFGKCSQQAISCERAWFAVNVGSGFPSNCCEIVKPPFKVCSNDLEQYIEIKSQICINGIYASSFSWNIPSNVTSYTQNFDLFTILERSTANTISMYVQGTRSGQNLACSKSIKTELCNIMHKAEKNENKLIAIYPNPGNGAFTITGFKFDSPFYITSIEGQVIVTGKFGNKAKDELTLTYIKTGVYFINFLDSANQNKTLKLIIIN